MPSRTKHKNAEIAARSAALPKIPKELMDKLVSGPMTGEEVNAATLAFKKALIERVMGAELGQRGCCRSVHRGPIRGDARCGGQSGKGPPPAAPFGTVPDGSCAAALRDLRPRAARHCRADGSASGARHRNPDRRTDPGLSHRGRTAGAKSLIAARASRLHLLHCHSIDKDGITPASVRHQSRGPGNFRALFFAWSPGTM